MLRQPVCVTMGHVDHGKTSLLDAIRDTNVQSKEAGQITQNISSWEVPIETIKANSCGLLERMKVNLTIPGILFIDTPGHEAFTNLRKRGGSISDIAILAVDVTKGIEAQTVEAIEILKEYKTPFVIALNKVDALSGWVDRPGCAVDSIKLQRQDVQDELDSRVYTLVGKLGGYGLNAERFDRVSDFGKQIVIIPVSAKTREGIPELLLFVAGLAQKFLENSLTVGEHGKASILEVREEKGVGKALDIILYDGVIRTCDEIAFATLDGPVVSRVKALLRPKSFRGGLESVCEASASAGLRVSCDFADRALVGSSLFVVVEGKEEEYEQVIRDELKELLFESDGAGVTVRADSLGSIEAIVKMFRAQGIPVRKAAIGRVSRQDVMQASALKEKEGFKYQGVIFAFNTGFDDGVKAMAEESNVKVFDEKIIYNLIEGYRQWVDEEQAREKRDAFNSMTFPAKIMLIPGCCFRVSKPAIFGVEVLEGRLKKGCMLMTSEGERVGELKLVQENKKPVEEAGKGKQVAVSVDEPTYGRQVCEKNVLYTDMNRDDVEKLEKKYLQSLSDGEKDLLKEIKKIKGYLIEF